MRRLDCYHGCTGSKNKNARAFQCSHRNSPKYITKLVSQKVGNIYTMVFTYNILFGYVATLYIKCRSTVGSSCIFCQIVKIKN